MNWVAFDKWLALIFLTCTFFPNLCTVYLLLIDKVAMYCEDYCERIFRWSTELCARSVESGWPVCCGPRIYYADYWLDKSVYKNGKGLTKQVILQFWFYQFDLKSRRRIKCRRDFSYLINPKKQRARQLTLTKPLLRHIVHRKEDLLVSQPWGRSASWECWRQCR